MTDAPEGTVPDNANQHCPGTASEEAGKSAACEGCPNQQICATAPKGPDPDLVAIAAQLANVKHIILVLSGKGGVGKSTVAAQMAFALASKGCEVGLLDIDICGPSMPKMLGLEGEEVHQSSMGWSPVYVTDNLGVMSIGFMLPDPDDAVIWRGPRKNSLIKQFLKDVHWGVLDYLIVDAPPGTSDEHISIAQFLSGSKVEGAVIVTTPQEVAIIDVRKEVNFCRKVGLPILGVVENMSGLSVHVSDLRFAASPDSSSDAANLQEKVLDALRAAGIDPETLVASTEVFAASKGGARAMCTAMKVPFLGSVPMDGALSRAGEEGVSVFEAATNAPSRAALRAIIETLQAQVDDKKQNGGA